MPQLLGHRGDRESVAVTRVPVPDLCCLWAETAATPMNIALVGSFDADRLVDDHGEVDLQRIRTSVADHLDQAPMLRRVLKPTRPGQGRPVWIDAADFTIDQHVVLVQPDHPFTDEQDFLDWSARETVRALDRSKPLWRMSIVPGLPDQRLGFLVVVHHVVADGLRGVAMIAGLLDVDPSATMSTGTWHPAPPPTAGELVVDNVRARVEAVRSIRLGRLRRRLVALRGLRNEISSHAPPTVLTGDIGHGRRLEVIRQPLENLSTAAHALGCTINDLLLAAVTHGLREMLSPQGDAADSMMLRATVPVGETNGHQAGMIAVTLPVGTDDPGERLHHIMAETSRLKQSPDGGIAGIVSMPAGLAHLGVLWARHAGAARINLYVTNVPGPPFPLYLAGAQLYDVVPLAPLVAGVRLSVTALSYDGVLFVALLADEALTEFPAMAAGVQASMDTYVSGANAARQRESDLRSPLRPRLTREVSPMRFLFFYLMADDPVRVREIAPLHAAYWQQRAPRGYLGGPFADRSGGLITFEANNPAQAEQLVGDDPFVGEGLLSSWRLEHWLAEAADATMLRTGRP